MQSDSEIYINTRIRINKHQHCLTNFVFVVSFRIDDSNMCHEFLNHSVLISDKFEKLTEAHWNIPEDLCDCTLTSAFYNPSKQRSAPIFRHLLPASKPMHPVRNSNPPPHDRKILYAVDATTRNRFSAALIANDTINESVNKNIYINCYRVSRPKE